MRFSVIIPTYNRAATILRAINSVFKQEYKDFEIIVVDDGSTDNTSEMVGNIKDVRLHYFKKDNAERAAARNFGALKANGKYIMFLDSDDTLYSNHLMVAESEIVKLNNPEVFHLGYDIKTDEDKVLSVVNKLPSPVNPLLIKGNCLSCNGVFLRRDIAMKNPFNEDRALSASEDWELWLRIASQYTIHTSNEITSTIINHENRSVLDSNCDKLIKRIEVFLDYALNNKDVTDYYKSKLNLLKSSCYTYVSLHIALTGKSKGTSIKYLLKGISESPASVFSRRFMAILKHLLR